jgi:hypothetical protein
MTAKIIAFPRRKPLDWSELPSYWEYPHKAYYTYAVEDGMSHPQAFRLHDLIARAPTHIAGLRYKTESDEEYLERLESIAMTPSEASARAATKRVRHGN